LVGYIEEIGTFSKSLLKALINVAIDIYPTDF